MADKKYIGTFESEQAVLDKIEELKAYGFSEDDMYIVTNDKDSLSMVQGQTDVDLRTSEGNWMDRFRAFINGDDPVRAAFKSMGFNEEASTAYYNEVKRGGVLLYVDRDYRHLRENYDAGTVNNHVDANLGSNMTVDYTGNTVNLDGSMHTEVVQTPISHEEAVLGSHAVQDEPLINGKTQSDEADLERSDYEELDLETEKDRIQSKYQIDPNRLL
ncbi:general stress protein [Sporosarcina sp. CAU 1771]